MSHKEKVIKPESWSQLYPLYQFLKTIIRLSHPHLYDLYISQVSLNIYMKIKNVTLKNISYVHHCNPLNNIDVLVFKSQFTICLVVFMFIVFISECPWQFQFGILVAGFKSHSHQHKKHYSDLITMPTLHVFGDTDKVIHKSK